MSQAGLANLNNIPPPPGSVTSLEGNDSVIVGPNGSGVIHLLGQSTVQVTGNAGTNTETISPTVSGWPITPYVVSQTGQGGYSTIQSAVNAAHAAGGGNVWVQGGTYNENLTLYPSITIQGPEILSGFPGDPYGVFINGSHTPPTTGGVTFNNVNLFSTGDCIASNAAGSAELNFTNVSIGVTNGYFLNIPNWTGVLSFWDVNSSAGTNDGGINNPSGGASVFAFEVGLGFGTTHTMQISGEFVLEGSEIYNSVQFNTGSVLLIDNTQFSGNVTLAGNTTGSISCARFTTGSLAAVTMSSSANVSISTANINSSNNPAIAGSGSGTLTLADISFLNNSIIAGTLTLATTGGWYPPGNVGSAGFVMTSNGAGVVPTFQAASVFINAWTDKATSFNAVAGNGYFITAGSVVATLPASATQGQTIAFYVDTTSSFEILANTGQFIRVGSAITASAGNSVNNARGDSLTLVFRSSDSVWCSTSDMGTWTLT